MKKGKAKIRESVQSADMTGKFAKERMHNRNIILHTISSQADSKNALFLSPCVQVPQVLYLLHIISDPEKTWNHLDRS